MFDLLQDRVAGLPRHDELGMNDQVSRQLLQSLEVVPKGLLHEVSLFHAGRADVTLEQLFGGSRDERRDLCFLFHDCL